MGDIVKVKTGTPCFHLHAIGTAPIENIEVFNGLKSLETIRPYHHMETGKRIKIVWSGAEVRGRARMSTWNGGITVTGNTIKKVEPVNFWKPHQQPGRIGKNRVTFESVTTGGLVGIILTLDKVSAGSITVETTQGRFKCNVKRIGINPVVKEYGGLKKRLELYRLPDKNSNDQCQSDR